MENKTVYLLWHTRYASNDFDEDNSKLLGVYSSMEYAEEKVKTKYRNLPGFKENNGEFTIAPYVIDDDNWNEGFGPIV